MGWASLSRPVDKIPRFTEMGGFQSGVFTLFPYRDQLLTQESHHVNPVSPRCRTKGNPTDMYRCREIYPILMFCPPFFYDHTVNQGFRDIISDQPRPHLLLDKLRLLGMKITQPHGIFQLPERALHAPSGPIKFFQTLQGELVPRKVGIDAFHIIHGPERTMIFSLNILCRALNIINDTFIEYIDDSSYSEINMKLVIQALEDMTLGVLKELDLSDDISMQKLDDIKKIMHLETASLITNSLLVGYLLSQNKEMNIINLLQEIGRDLGYIFQVLNDLEPFCSKRNNGHKGSLNAGISRNRKNICVPLLYIYLTSKEKRKLKKASSEEKDVLLLNLFQKYRIQEKLFKEIHNVSKRIHNSISLMTGKPQLQEWCNQFDAFVDSVITVSQKRLE